MGSLEAVKKDVDELNKKASQALRLFTQLHVEREDFLEEITRRGVQNLEEHEKRKYHKLLRKNVKRDEKVSKAVVKGTDNGVDIVHYLNKVVEKAGKADKHLKAHLGYLEKVFEEAKHHLDFLEDRSRLYRKNDGEFRLLLETIQHNHKAERERFKTLLSVVEPSKLSETERLGKRISEGFKRVVYPVGGAAVGGWFGDTLASMGEIDTAGQIQATPEQVQNARLVGAVIIGAIGLCYAIHDACKAVERKENSFEARRDAAALAEQLEAYKK